MLCTSAICLTKAVSMIGMASVFSESFPYFILKNRDIGGFRLDLAGFRSGPVLDGADEGLAGGEDNRRVVYRTYSVIHVAPRTTSRLAAFVVNDRPAVIISYEDLSLAVLGVRHWGINGYNTESARRLVSNMLLAADSEAAAHR